MQSGIVYKLKSKIKVKITGRKVEYFLKKLMSSKIELLDIKLVNHKELIVLIYKKDYEKLLEIKSIYEIEILGYRGSIKIKKLIGINKILISFIFLGLALLMLLSNTIFEVEVVHNDKNIRDFLTKELSNYDIKTYKFKKNFEKIEKIKKEILEKYRDKIEWLEIENIGTKYIVKVEERKIIDTKKDYTKRNVVAIKPAIIKKVFAKNGVILKNVDDYVNKGDVVISGEVMLNETVKETIKAEGEIFGEVWYNIKVEYPYIYSEKKVTGNTKNTLALNLLNKRISLFNKYKDFIVEDKTLLKHLFLPLSLVKQKQREVSIVEYVLTEEEALDSALKKAREQMNNKLDEDEYIISEKQLKVNIKESIIVVDVFYAVYENITGYEKIEEIEN